MVENCNKFEFKFLGYVIDEKRMDDAGHSRQGVSSFKIAVAIKSLKNANE